MSDESYAAKLQALCSDYFRQRIGFQEYRERRKALLSQIDAELNGSFEDGSRDTAVTTGAGLSTPNGRES